MKIWFTADLHLGHKNIIKYCDRPWATVEEHDEALLANWTQTVGEDDTVFVLGDLVMGSIKKYTERLVALPGTKHFIAGNHDSIWQSEGDKRQKYDQQLIAAGFTKISGDPMVSISNWPLGWEGIDRVVLSHFPAEGESVLSRPDRFSDHRPADDGAIILCGHVHDQWKRKGMNINVGVDVRGYKPVLANDLYSEALEALNERYPSGESE